MDKGSSVSIVADGDLRLTVLVTEKVWTENEETTVTKEQTTFQVSRAVLKEKSEAFSTKFFSHPGKTAYKCHIQYIGRRNDEIEIKDDSIRSVEIWLRAIHRQMVAQKIAHTDIDLKEVWHVIAVFDKYGTPLDALKNWFATWYDSQPVATWFREWRAISTARDEKEKNKSPRTMLYPTYRFDHARGFMKATQFLAYNMSGHITEESLLSFENDRNMEHRLPGRLIQQINAARGRLRTIVFRPIYGSCKDLVGRSCPCHANVLDKYLESLIKTKAGIMDEPVQIPIHDVIDRLNTFQYKGPSRACVAICRKDFDKKVKGKADRARGYFDGLCLDCLDKSKTKTGDSNRDYWKHGTLKEDEWVNGCRISHKQPTWYFSFMGRHGEQEEYRRGKRKMWEIMMGLRTSDDDSDE